MFFLLSFFLSSFCQIPKGGQNSPKKHGSICSSGHKFQIWGLIWPQRLFGGHSGLKTSLLRTSIRNLEVFLTKFKRSDVFLTKFKISKTYQKFFKNPQKFSKNSPKIFINQTKMKFFVSLHVSRRSIRSEPCWRSTIFFWNDRIFLKRLHIFLTGLWFRMAEYFWSGTVMRKQQSSWTKKLPSGYSKWPQRFRLTSRSIAKGRLKFTNGRGRLAWMKANSHLAHS